MRFIDDPTVRDSIQADVEYLERFIAEAVTRNVSSQALEGVRKQLALLKESRDKYEEAVKFSATSITVSIKE